MKKLIHFIFKFFNKKIINIDTDTEQIKEFISKIHALKTEYQLIRIGSSKDGGYLLPDDLENIEAVFSPGVSNIHSFELDMLEKFNVKSFMCDFTVDNIFLDNKDLIFKKKHLGVINNNKYQRLEDWVNSNSKTNDLILQMDIEGSEYPVILDTPLKTLDKFRIMIIEFHDLDLLFNYQSFELYNSIMNKILTKFSVVHLHPNNCCGTYVFKDIEIPKVLEITFLNKNRLSKNKYQKTKSKRHELDVDNTKLPSIDLPENWF